MSNHTSQAGDRDFGKKKQEKPELGAQPGTGSRSRILLAAGNGYLRSRLATFLSHRRANVATVFAVALLPILAAVGLATDSSLALVARSQLADALDSAGLAAGRAIFSENAEADAQHFFEANFPAGHMSATVTDFEVEIDENEEFVTLTATAVVPTRFMQLFGHDEINLRVRTVVHRQNRGMELALVMDNTGSMRSNGKIDAMKNAAAAMIEQIYGEEEQHDDLWVSVVPYTITVNAGNQHGSWLASTDQFFADPSPFAPSSWLGCVEAREAPFDGDDTPPALAPFTSYLYEEDVDNDWTPLKEENHHQNNGTGPNLGCGPAITELSQNKATILAAIDEMQPWHRGGTAGNLGLSWGWRTISPRWQGLWGGNTPVDMPFAYETEHMDKVVVILTDGKNQFYDWPDHSPNGGIGPLGSDYTSYGRLEEFGFASLDAARDELDTRMAETCAAMKAEGIIMFTITFGPTPDQQAQDLFRDCASTPSQYFHAPTNDELAETFQTIAHELSNLRIAE